jgi:hypothetical protein
MAAVLLVARTQLRARRASLSALAILVALVAAVVLAAGAGARRTSTALDRYLAFTQAADAAVGVAARPSTTSDHPRMTQLAQKIDDLAGVQRVSVEVGYATGVESEFDFALLGRYPSSPDVSGPFVLSGRMPETDAVEEVALSELAADEQRLGIGDVLHVPTVSVEGFEAVIAGQLDEFVFDGPEFDLTVVGIVRDTDSLSPKGTNATPVGYVSPSFVQSAGADASTSYAMFFIEADESFDLAPALTVAREEDPEAEVFGSTIRERVGDVDTAFGSIAFGLLLFAAVAAAGGVLALGQAVSRQIAISSSVVQHTRELGMRRRQRVIAVVLPLALATVAGLLAGVVVAVLASPLFPISVARRAEVDPGIRVEWAVLLLGASAILCLVVVWSLIVAWLQSHPARRVSSSRSSMLSKFSRVLSPAAAIGCATVLAPSRRTVRAGTALVGAVVSVTAVAAIVVFSQSHHAALAEPANYGWMWSSAPDVYGDDTDATVTAIAEDPRIEAVGGLFCSDLTVDAQPHPVCAVAVASGSLHLRISAGRAPASADEIALGATTMRDLATSIGDTVDIPREDGSTQTFRVVGQVIMVPIDGAHPGIGAAVTEEGLAQLSGSPQGDRQTLVLRYGEGVEATIVERSLEERFTVEFTAYSRPSPPERLVQLDRIRPILAAVAVFLGALGAIGLTHYLALSTRRRNNELAVLRALGFLRSQIRVSLACQAVTVAVIGLVVGIPAGILIGRQLWSSAVDQLGMHATPSIPIAIGIALTVATVLGAATIGTVTAMLRRGGVTARSLTTE